MENATSAAVGSVNTFDIEKIRSDFPFLKQKVRGKELVYLDSAATTQKPRYVIETMDHYYKFLNANIHRGVHYFSQIATDAYEAARDTIRKFINASSRSEIIFTKGTTESINLVASTYGRMQVHEGDEIIISEMEHHSNIVPWQMLCKEKNAKLRVVPMDDTGAMIMDEYKKMFNEKTKLVAIVHQSNTLGTTNPAKEIVEIAHSYYVPVLLDGAQAVQHFTVDVQELDCDFYAFSGHKIYGPTGIGILYGKEKFLEMMPPYQGGGDMIDVVTFEETTYNELPYKFEAGTPNMNGGIGLGAAIEYVNSVGIENIDAHEMDLLTYANKVLLDIEGVRVIGNAKSKGSVFSFVMGDIHPHDIGTILDLDGIAIRTGHMCTQPTIRHFNIPAVARAAFAMYNNKEDIDKLAAGLKKVREVFG